MPWRSPCRGWRSAATFPEIVGHLLGEIDPTLTISGEALAARPWPGNIRELRHAAARQLETALVAEGGNVAAAARRLGVSRTTVYRHLRAGDG